jgi:hypothetical protein
MAMLVIALRTPSRESGASGLLLFACFACGLAVSLFAQLVIVRAVTAARLGRRQRGDVRISAGGVTIDGRAMTRSGGHAFGHVEAAKGGGAVAVISDNLGPRLAIATATEAQATAILACLDRGHARRVTSFLLRLRLGQRITRTQIATFVGTFPLVMMAIVVLHVPLPLLVFLASPALFVAALPVTTTVGADGFSARWLHVREFVPFTRVRAITRGPGSIVVELADAAPLHIAGSQDVGDPSDDQRSRMDALFTALLGAFEAFRQRVPEDAAALVARHGPSVRAWLTSLDQASGEGYRKGALSDERLWAIANDPGAPESARAGAAFLLARAGGPTHRPRIDALAESCASPRLRVALTSLTSDDASIERAFEALPVASRGGD